MKKPQAHLVISLDFELFWGMSDVTTLDAYSENIRGVRTALPRMLDLFSLYSIHATWATVGMLMCRNKDELLSLLPPHDKRPTYTNPRMSTYYHIEHDGVGRNEEDDPYHYGPTLVQRILQTPHQEFANHTFSHFYAHDGKNNPSILESDLKAHASITKTYGCTTTSIIFPRNQVSEEALRICEAQGITAYRGNEDHFLYRARKAGDNSLVIRGLRLLDHYVNLSGYHTYKLKIENLKFKIVNVPASRFLRPYMPALKLLEPLRMFRIKRAMTHAAKRGEVFHLWWHPHNFGINQTENFKNLTEILEHFKKLQKEYGMQSVSMRELASSTSV
jgi:hypothetical protein